MLRPPLEQLLAIARFPGLWRMHLPSPGGKVQGNMIVKITKDRGEVCHRASSAEPTHQPDDAVAGCCWAKAWHLRFIGVSPFPIPARQSPLRLVDPLHYLVNYCGELAAVDAFQLDLKRFLRLTEREIWRLRQSGTALHQSDNNPSRISAWKSLSGSE
jgi:hypothetical protein